MEKLKKSLTNELTSKNAKENPQVLITVVQILLGFIIGAIGSLGGIAESLTSNSWLVGIAALLCVLLPLSTKIQILCSSDFLRKISFYLFSLSVGVVLAFISQYLGGFFFGIWMYLGTALLLFYEYNGISQCELKKSFKFVVFGLVIISTGIELVVICDWNIMYFICVPIILLISILLSYSLICAAKSVDEIKKDSENTRESLLEDNLIVWRLFPFKVVQSFPDFIMYLKEICINRNYELLKE